MFKQIAAHENVIKAAKCRMDYDKAEIDRLRELCMTKTGEVNQKDKKIYHMAKDMGRQALRYTDINTHQQETIANLKQKLFEERQKSKTLEEELHFTRKRLLTHKRRSVPRRCKRVRRRIIQEDDESTISAGSDSDTEVETKEATNVVLVNAMMDTSDI